MNAPIPAPSTAIRWPLLVAALIATVLIQAAVPLVRISTSYKAIAHGLGADQIGVISAGFALLPIFLAVRIGRFNDAGHDGLACVIGAFLLIAATFGMIVSAPGFVFLFAFTSLLGVGQLFVLSASQMLANRSAGAKSQDMVVGYLMVAISFGQILGPLLLGLSPADAETASGSETLFWIALIGFVLLLATGLLLWRMSPAPAQRGLKPRAPLSTILNRQGLLAVIVASSLCVTAGDLALVYLPLIGVERGLSPATVGALLSLRAAIAMASRLCYSRAVTRFGHVSVMVCSMAVAAVATFAIAVDAPLWVLVLTMVASGFGLGMALTASLSLTLSLAPVEAQATAISLRLTANRVGQFLIPLLSGAAAGAIGVGGVFAVTSGALLVSGLTVRQRKKG